MAETNQTMFPSNASALTPNETKKPIMDIALSKVPEQDKDSDGLPMWVPLVAIIIALVVIALVVYFKRRG
uniref:Synaptotagmin n=1 Tax=Plectus sambesii TaxID=2011161 RepID=A0A914WNB5_9BILA